MSLTSDFEIFPSSGFLESHLIKSILHPNSLNKTPNTINTIPTISIIINTRCAFEKKRENNSENSFGTNLESHLSLLKGRAEKIIETPVTIKVTGLFWDIKRVKEKEKNCTYIQF